MLSNLAHKSENVYNLSDILILDHDVRDVLYGPAQNCALCRRGPSQDSQAVGRQPAIPRSLEYRTILYKTTFVLDKLCISQFQALTSPWATPGVLHSTAAPGPGFILDDLLRLSFLIKISMLEAIEIETGFFHFLGSHKGCTID